MPLPVGAKGGEVLVVGQGVLTIVNEYSPILRGLPSRVKEPQRWCRLTVVLLSWSNRARPKTLRPSTTDGA